MIDEVALALQNQIDLLYEIVSKCIPRKTFQAALNQIKDEQQKQSAKPSDDPRVDELVNRVNSLQDHLPRLISEAVQSAMTSTGMGTAKSRPAPKRKQESPDMDFGEEQSNGNES